jgi:dihydropteroate synthase
MRTRPHFRLRVGGRVVELGARTVIMGILNVTPDSFSDGGLYLNPRQAVQRAVEMARQGADWIDVGGESTRPGSSPVNAEQELRRVLPVIRMLRQRMPDVPISVDTTKAAVADEALAAGANIVNDISGLRFHPGLAEVARRHRAPLIVMHLRGRPATMQSRPFARSISRSISRGLGWSIRRALSLGVPRAQLIIDPGLGFGKTRLQNFEILAQLERLQRFRLPVLAGASRKSFIRAIVEGEGLKPHNGKSKACRNTAGRPIGQSGAKTRTGASQKPSTKVQSSTFSAIDFGDAAAAVAAVLAGAHIVRVHSVRAILPAVRVADAILASWEFIHNGT